MHRWKWDEVNRWWNRVQMEKWHKKKREKKKKFFAALHMFWVEKKQTLGADRWCRWSKFNLAGAYQEFTPRARTFRVTLDSALSLFLSLSPVSIFRYVPYIMNTINLLRSFARWQQVGGVSGGLAVSDRDWLMFLWSAHSVRSPLISPTQEKWLDGGVAGRRIEGHEEKGGGWSGAENEMTEGRRKRWR